VEPREAAAQARQALLKRAVALSFVSVVWNGIAGTAAVVFALFSGSLALAGFGFDAVIDSAASVALIWRFTVETSQPERAARVERTAERIVGLSLIATGAYIAAGAVRALAIGTHPESSLAAAGLLVASLIFLPPLAAAKGRVARRLGSGALRGDSVLTAVAALLAAISLLTILLETFGLWWADSVGALIVAALVLREGWGAVAASRRVSEE
jgi:divalent metal cation (Fe/Co/Zn/Cd) transporter